MKMVKNDLTLDTLLLIVVVSRPEFQSLRSVAICNLKVYRFF